MQYKKWTHHWVLLCKYGCSIVLCKMCLSNKNSKPAPYTSPPEGKWSTGLCDCFEDPSNCKEILCLFYFKWGKKKKKRKNYQNSVFNIWGATCIICKFPCWSVPKFSKNYMKCAILFSNININLEHLTTTNQSKKEKTRCKYLLTNSIVFFPLKVGLPVAVPSSPLAVMQR